MEYTILKKLNGVNLLAMKSGKEFDIGDIVLLDFTPQSGHEQMGKRPALIVSNKIFIKFTKLAIVCPITSTKRGVPIQIELNNKTKTQGVIMCEQLKSLDLYARQAVFLEKAPKNITQQVIEIIYSFF